MVNIGIVGVGSLGTRHAVNVRCHIPGAELYAICGRPQTTRRFVDAYGEVPVVYSDYEAMLADDHIDGIMIVTPVKTHGEMVKKALAAGRHTFVEKPLGLTTADAIQAEQAASLRPENILMTGYMRRFDRSYVDAKARIERGEIGTPIVFRGYSLDKDASPESAPERGDRNGAWFPEMLVHDVDLARWFLGSKVETIRTIGGCFKHEVFAKYKDVDNACTLMSFENGAMAFFYTGRTAPHGSHVETEIVGTEGMIRVNPVPARDRVTLYEPGGVRVECCEDYIDRFNDAFIAEISHFVRCIEEGRKPRMTPHDARMASEIANAAYDAYLTGELKTMD